MEKSTNNPASQFHYYFIPFLLFSLWSKRLIKFRILFWYKFIITKFKMIKMEDDKIKINSKKNLTL